MATVSGKLEPMHKFCHLYSSTSLMFTSNFFQDGKRKKNDDNAICVGSLVVNECSSSMVCASRIGRYLFNNMYTKVQQHLCNTMNRRRNTKPAGTDRISCSRAEASERRRKKIMQQTRRPISEVSTLAAIRIQRKQAGNAAALLPTAEMIPSSLKSLDRKLPPTLPERRQQSLTKRLSTVSTRVAAACCLVKCHGHGACMRSKRHSSGLSGRKGKLSNSMPGTMRSKQIYFRHLFLRVKQAALPSVCF
eukprot:284819117_4